MKRVLNRFGDSDGKKPLPYGRGSVSRAESTRLLPSRDRQGAVSPKRLSTRGHSFVISIERKGVCPRSTRPHTLRISAFLMRSLPPKYEKQARARGLMGL